MARKNHGPSSPELRGKLQDSLSIDSIPEFFPTSNSKKGGGKNDFKGGNRGDAKKQSVSSSAKRARANYKLNFHSLDEIFKMSTSNKFKEPQLLCQVQPFQSGRFTCSERAPPKKGDFLCETDLEKHLFFIAFSLKLSKVYKISMLTEVVPVHLPLF